MLEVEYATIEDVSVWLTFDKHISKNELLLKIGNRRCYLLKSNAITIGIMRYNFFLGIPFPFLHLFILVSLIKVKDTVKKLCYGGNPKCAL